MGQLGWWDRSGNLLEKVGQVGPWGSLALNSDGTRAVVSHTGGLSNLRMIDLSRDVPPTRFSFEPAGESAVWSPEDDHVAYESRDPYALMLRPSNGAGDPQTLLMSAASHVAPQDYAPDGTALLYVTSVAGGANDLMLLPLEPDGTAAPAGIPYLTTRADEFQAQFSPDGQWVVYVSSELGFLEVFVRPSMPDASGSGNPAGGKLQVSTGGGFQPRWDPTGTESHNEIFYLSRAGEMMSVTLDTSGPLPEILERTPLFSVHIVGEPANRTMTPYWDISADGERFLINSRATDETSSGITVVLNWEEDLGR